MMTVHEVSALAGVSERALRHYDAIGLLAPTEVNPAGYRLYDDAALERLQCILLFRELQFPLKDIAAIVDSPAFDRDRALEQQIALLRLKREQLDKLIDLAEGIQRIGVRNLDFTAFDHRKLDEYARQAKASWGATPAYREFEEKSKGRSRDEERRLGMELMAILAAFGTMLDQDPAGEAAQAQVRRLQGFITEHWYNCTDDILRGLGQMYAAGGSMTENIDRAGGPGTAAFAARAIASMASAER